MDMVSQVKRLAKQSLFERKFLHLKDKNTSRSNGVKGSNGTKSLRTQSSHRSTSSVYSRTKERVKVAELLAEKAMIRRKQALDVAAKI
jgi:hypothetical protein